MPSEPKPRTKDGAASPKVRAPKPMVLEEQLCFALYSASLAMTKFYKSLLVPLALTYPQFLVMSLMWEQDAQTVGSLCDRLFLDSGTLTPLLKRLEAQQLITRERDPEDERRVIARLTTEGKTLQTKANGLSFRIPRAIGYSTYEIEHLIKTLATIRSRLSSLELDAV
jgi:DNA-binding MarR family transcriptional regulator